MVNSTETIIASWWMHPALGALVFTLLCLWPLARIFRRSGRSPWLALLFLPNAVFPFAGYILTGAAFLICKVRHPGENQDPVPVLSNKLDAGLRQHDA